MTSQSNQNSTSIGSIRAEVRRRRTFAIISHPDAGKTTLTEKLLLYSGMIRTAGMVQGRKSSKQASSDWMSLEQERGISITASAMQFEYQGAVINVLDTPGHQDFSEDTYRTLTAADSAIMVIDAAKGVEAQTRKLFAVCALRGIPVLTFINKMDLPGQDPFDLIAELEEVLGIEASPHNWPIGSGREFRGVAECESKNLFLFEKTSKGGAQETKDQVLSLEEAARTNVLTEYELRNLKYELELLEEAGNDYSEERFLQGKVTKVFFGSALTNFGLRPFFDSFVKIAPSPHPRLADGEDGSEISISPSEPFFSGFVFKIQANMDPRHRDSMAFVRICSGTFERDASVIHHRTGKSVRLSQAHRMFAGERDTVDLAFPGDIIGLINPGSITIGDTISTKGGFNYKPLPRFAPEVVARIRPKNVEKRKAFDNGIKRLGQEGAVQVLTPVGETSSDQLIAAVGKLQFEVLQYRLLSEYKVDTVLSLLPYNCGAWLVGDLDKLQKHSRSLVAKDPHGNVVVLFQSIYEKEHSQEKNPDLQFLGFVQ